jgi:hypothetical protein
VDKAVVKITLETAVDMKAVDGFDEDGAAVETTVNKTSMETDGEDLAMDGLVEEWMAVEMVPDKTTDNEADVGGFRSFLVSEEEGDNRS